MGIVFGCIVPHPPIIVPDIGRGNERITSATIKALEELCFILEKQRPEIAVVISPHGTSFYNAMGILTAPSSRGDLRDWGSRMPELHFKNDLDFVSSVQKEAKASNIPLRTIGEKNYFLDHGVMVPLFYLARALKGVALVPISFSGLPLKEHFSFGQVLNRASEAIGKRVVVLASGDLSHRLLPQAPAGYHPQGKVFDEKVVEAVKKWDKEAILNLDPQLIEDAGECGLRSIVILFGAMEGLKVKPKVLSYEGPFGVGYLVASVEIENPKELHPIVKLAKEAVEAYIREGKVIKPKELTPEMKGRAGVFVSIKKFGELRGCIGTFEPTKANIAEEIIANAISSATQDPRFPPVREDELKELEYSVDVLTKPEPVKDIKELDPKRYGVIVVRGWRKGLLLPDLEGVDTVEEQIDICRRKAGILPDEPIEIYRFEVKRYK